MISYPSLALKQELITSLSNASNRIIKKESENLSMLVRRSGKLYFKLKDNSNIIFLLKELQDSKGKIIRDKLFQFYNQNSQLFINSPEIIKMLSNYKIFDKLNTPIIPEETEDNEKNSETPKNCEEQNIGNICEEQFSNMDNYYEKMSTLGHNQEYNDYIPEDSNLKKTGSELDTKEKTKSEKEKKEIKELIKSIDEFSNKIKIYSLNDSIDTLICDINILDVEKYLEFFSNNNSFQDWISPKFKESYFYIPLPNWANTCKSLNFNYILFIIIELILLLNYQFFDLKGKNFKYCDCKHINDKYERTINNINNLKTFLITNYPNKIEFLLSTDVLKYTSKIAAKSYLNNYNIQKIIFMEHLADCFEKILFKLKNNLEQYSKNEEKIVRLFEKLICYTFDDILYVRHFVYSSFLNLILSYIIEKLSADLSPKILDIYNKISNYKPTWDLMRYNYINFFLSQIKRLLIDEYSINFYYYGSSTTGLDNIGSDIDIKIYYIPIKKMYVDFLSNLNQKLQLLKQNYQYMVIRPILDATVPIIKIEINLSEKVFNMNDKTKNEVFNVFNKEDITTIKIDISATYNLETLDNMSKMTYLINYELYNYPIIRPVISYLKFYLNKYKMNSVIDGWLSSLAIFLMVRNIVKTYIKENPFLPLNVGKILILFLEKYSNYNFDYLIDKNGYDMPYIQSNTEDKKFFITNPIETDKNVSPNPKKTEQIKKCFAQLLKIIILKREIPF